MAIERNTDPQLQQYEDENELSTQKWSPVFKRIERSRNYVKGYKRGKSVGKQIYDSEYSHDHFVQTNVVLSTLNSLTPLVYASNPSVAVLPAQHVTPRHPEYTMIRKFAKTCELAIQDTFREAKLKKRMKAALRSQQAAKVGIMKMSYQRDYYRDPMIENRINDAQDQLANIGVVMEHLQADGVHITDEVRQVKEKELQDMIAALEQQVEVLRAEGMVIDNIRVEDFRMDPAIDCLDDYLNARWQSHRTFYPPSTAQTMLEATAEQAEKWKRYGKNADGTPIREGEQAYSSESARRPTASDTGKMAHDRNTLVAVWERWDRDTNSVYTWVEGDDEWAKPAWAPKKGGERFFPFFILAFNWIDGEEWPISEAELLMELQDEYQLTREQQAKHRWLSRPFWIMDAGGTTDGKDVKTFNNAVVGEVVAVDSQGQRPSDVFSPAQISPMNPVTYDTTQIRTDIDLMSGLPDATRGSIMRAKTATEATMQDQGLTGRTGEKQDITEELLTEMAEYALQILLQEVDPMEMKRRYGQDAVWPMLESKWDLYNTVTVEIRAGSTGKPNKTMDLQQWTMLAPQIQQTLDRAIAMQMQMGMPIEENPYVSILRETLRRADERIDPIEFLGGMFGELRNTALQASQQPGGPGIAAMLESIMGGRGPNTPGGGTKGPDAAGERTDSDAVSYVAQGTPQMGPQNPEPLQ